MNGSGDELNGGGRRRAAFSKMGLVRSFDSEIRASKSKNAGEVANSVDFRNDSEGDPLQNGFTSRQGCRLSAISCRLSAVSYQLFAIGFRVVVAIADSR